jgi:putative transposase
MITRRCTERMFLLGTTKETGEVFAYCLAEAANRFGILVHAAVVMSNHLHIVVTDVEGKLPLFSSLFFTQLAKATNARTGHVESVFARAHRYHALELVTADAIACKIAYLLANPVKAGLVERCTQWPGFITSVRDMQERKVYQVTTGDNPYLQRRKATVLPLKIVPPPQVRDVQAFASRIAQDVTGIEKHYARERRAHGVLVKGAESVRAEKWHRKPTTGVTLFQTVPGLAERVKKIRIAAIQALQRFRQAYRDALKDYRAGLRAAEFPCGTWWMKVTFGANVALA